MTHQFVVHLGQEAIYLMLQISAPMLLAGLLIGLGISMDRDASAMVRMQLDISNQGYAAGVAAALAAQEGIAVRAIGTKSRCVS